MSGRTRGSRCDGPPRERRPGIVGQLGARQKGPLPRRAPRAPGRGVSSGVHPVLLSAAGIGQAGAAAGSLGPRGIAPRGARPRPACPRLPGGRSSCGLVLKAGRYGSAQKPPGLRRCAALNRETRGARRILYGAWREALWCAVDSRGSSRCRRRSRARDLLTCSLPPTPLPPPAPADQQYLYNSFGLAYLDNGFLKLPTDATIAPGEDPVLFNVSYLDSAKAGECRFNIKAEGDGICGATSRDFVACGLIEPGFSPTAYQTNGGKITVFSAGRNLDNSDWLATSGTSSSSSVSPTSRWNGEHVVKFLSSSFRERRRAVLAGGLAGCSLCLPQRPARLLRKPSAPAPCAERPHPPGPSCAERAAAAPPAQCPPTGRRWCS